MITVYTQPDCQPCKQAIKVLEDAGLTEGDNFTVIDIREDEDAFVYVADHLEAKVTPVIESDIYDSGALIFGFTAYDKPRLWAFIYAEQEQLDLAEFTADGIDGYWLH
ncbi:glutaredoxin family protein [Nocardia abscessus]|uniref:glutaredoxin family protein n=1 Tax=Nocardia abscessus TaxID=120957 RepID=UPI002457ACF7|nr:glutaredoxin family protein [Nocardia abscessus]